MNISVLAKVFRAIWGLVKKLPTVFKAIGNILIATFRFVWGLTKSFLKLFKKALHWKNLFHYDNILATGSLLLFLGAFSGINLEVVNPIGDAFSDVELTDLAFSRMGRNSELREGDYDHLPRVNKDITIVNIGDLRRDQVQEILAKVNSYSPKVVAFDAFFSKDKGILDYLLVDEFKKTKNLVLVTKLGGLDSLNTYDTIIDASHKKFLNNATSGFANMVINNKISYKAGSVTRNFLTQAVNRETNDTIYPWAVEVVRKYNPEVLNKLFKRNNREEIIDYVGNVHVMNMLLPDNYRKDIKWDKPHFQVIEYQILLDMINQSEDQVSLDSSIFKDKIVLFGYLGKRIDVEESGEDLFYTPLNEKYVGKTPQDMYGLVIHANIIANILRGDYIDESNRTFMHVIGFLITYLVFAFYRPIYDDHKIWYDGLTKFLGIALSLIILGVIGMIFDWLNYKIVFGAIWFGCILLAGDWLEIYYGLIKNLFNKIIKTKIQQS